MVGLWWDLSENFGTNEIQRVSKNFVSALLRVLANALRNQKRNLQYLILQQWSKKNFRIKLKYHPSQILSLRNPDWYDQWMVGLNDLSYSGILKLGFTWEHLGFGYNPLSIQP